MHGAATSATLSEALEVEGLLRLMTDMLISTSDIKFSSKMLGQGAFGTVYLAQWKVGTLNCRRHPPSPP